MKHSFSPAVAADVGVNAAVIFENIVFWIRHNQENGTQFHDGKYWTFNSNKAFQTQFPYMTEKQVRTAIEALKKAGYIITGSYSGSPFDRTTWFALGDKGDDYERKDNDFQGASTCPAGQMRIAPQGKCLKDIKQDNKLYVCKEPPKKPAVDKSEFYPRSVEEVLALSRTPMCGLPCTNEVAEAYFIDRVRKDWTINGQFKQIPPGAVALDLKAWIMRNRENERAARNSKSTRRTGVFQDGKNIPDADYWREYAKNAPDDF